MRAFDIPPSTWKLDVFDEEYDQLPKAFKKQYGMHSQVYKEYVNASTPMVLHTNSIRKSKAKGENRIVLVIPRSAYTSYILVHELVHFMYVFGEVSGVEINAESQEWQAILFEHMYVEIANFFESE